jgi:Rnl2 family RNA ligase
MTELLFSVPKHPSTPTLSSCFFQKKAWGKLLRFLRYVILSKNEQKRVSCASGEKHIISCGVASQKRLMTHHTIERVITYLSVNKCLRRTKTAMTSAPHGAFKPYKQMTNKVKNWVTEGTDTDASGRPNVEWIATPKIHGTNMSVTVYRDREGVHFARRHAFLGKDTAFMGFGEVLPGLAPWRDFLADFPDSVVAVTIFGEFFGGSYPGFPAQLNGRPIQTGVHYSPTKRFVAFDIRITSPDKKPKSTAYVDFPVMQALCKKHAVPYVEDVFRGSFDMVQQWARDHAADDVNPAFYQVTDLPIVPGNAGEGWVIRPCRELPSTIKGTRVMVKVKNPLFSESARISGVGRVKVAPGESKIVTSTRVANVLTKELPETIVFANFRHLVHLVVQDARADAGSLCGGGAGAGHGAGHGDGDGDGDEHDHEHDEDPTITEKTAGVLVRKYIEDLNKSKKKDKAPTKLPTKQ